MSRPSNESSAVVAWLSNVFGTLAVLFFFLIMLPFFAAGVCGRSPNRSA